MALHPFIVDRANCTLLVVDVQEKFRNVIDGMDAVIESCRRLVAGAKLLGIPILVTEQYPQGLGPTVPELAGELEAAGAKPTPKVSFSCCGTDEFMQQLATLGKKQIVVCGIETHICVLETCLGLLGSGYDVFLASDAVSSRSKENRAMAIDQIRQAGGVVTAVESVLFQAMGASTVPEFKEVQRLVK